MHRFATVVIHLCFCRILYSTSMVGCKKFSSLDMVQDFQIPVKSASALPHLAWAPVSRVDQTMEAFGKNESCPKFSFLSLQFWEDTCRISYAGHDDVVRPYFMDSIRSVLSKQDISTVNPAKQAFRLDSPFDLKASIRAGRPINGYCYRRCHRTYTRSINESLWWPDWLLQGSFHDPLALPRGS